MNTRPLFTMFVCATIAHLTFAVAPAAAPTPATEAVKAPAAVEKASTLANLQAAYNGASNAKA